MLPILLIVLLDAPANETRPLPHGASKLEAALASHQPTWTAPLPRSIVLRVDPLESWLGAEGFRVAPHSKRDEMTVTASTGAGAMHGALRLATAIAASPAGSWARFVAGARDPMQATFPLLRTAARFEYRALKINMPWSAYRNSSETALSWDAMRNLSFWTSYLDAAADNGFNVLSIWSMHPYPLLLRSKSFPKATTIGDAELEAWRALHVAIFKLARDRAIEPYLVDWNVFVSEGFEQHYDSTSHSDTDGASGNASMSALSQQYNRECITQMIDEYDDLAGIGISLGDRVHNMNLSQQLEWVEAVVFPAIHAAKRGDEIKLIYRAAFGEGTDRNNDAQMQRECLKRSGINGARIWVQLKFNWSHGHSTTTLVHVHGGGKAEGFYVPPPTSEEYRVTWMMRNEDFFALRWGNAPFTRAHVAVNGESWVGGYAIGSEGYIPALDYFVKKTKNTAVGDLDVWSFQRQWLFYATWGQTLFDGVPSNVAAADASLAGLFVKKYGATAQPWAGDLLQGYVRSFLPPAPLCVFTLLFTAHSPSHNFGVDAVLGLIYYFLYF